MRNIPQLAISLVLLATQVQDPFTGSTATAQVNSTAVVAPEVTFDQSGVEPIVVTAARPDYEAEVLKPLQEAQAAKAKAEAEARAKARAKLAAKTSVKTASTGVKAPATAENMLKLRLCEAGNIYTRNSGNGYYGAYQYNLSTWGNWMGYARPDLAPAEVQDAKFLETYARRGWSPWPACSRKLGLM